MNYLHLCFAGKVARHDLLAAHEALEACPESAAMRIVLIRHLILEIANVADLATMSGALYKDNQGLGEQYSRLRKGLEFFKYLRNQYVGHFSPDLAEKTAEWYPDAYRLLDNEDPIADGVISWFALETAINTFCEPDTGHKVFDSETDLNYPPDLRRFLNYLGDTAILSLEYLTRLIATARAQAPIPDLKTEGLKLAINAGDTTFSVLTKGRR